MWEKQEDVIAQKFTKKQVPGFFSKKIKLGPTEVGVEEKDGKVVKEYEAGEHHVFEEKSDEIVLIDKAEKKIKKEVSGLWTKDNNQVDIVIEIGFKVIHKENFIRNLFAGKETLKIDDIYSNLYSELLTKVLAPEIKKFSTDELYGNQEIQEEIKTSFEVELKKTFELWGLELTQLIILWKLPEDYEQFLKSESSFAREEKEKELIFETKLKDAERERELEQIKGEEKGTEAVKSDLEKEKLKREVELELRKKESAQDTEEALEALELKQIIDKQKKLNEEKE